MLTTVDSDLTGPRFIGLSATNRLLDDAVVEDRWLVIAIAAWLATGDFNIDV
jgi:hypothetical protein